ncbi:hypothetical protein G9A89_015816 [Geosiphon pyriformis]|nr:hypothetical protein G9A89_015816 [Geosiphon pyriformis]
MTNKGITVPSATHQNYWKRMWDNPSSSSKNNQIPSNNSSITDLASRVDEYDEILTHSD